MEDRREGLEDGLLLKRDGDKKEGFRCLVSDVVKEVKVVSYISGPMVVVNLSQYFLQVISIMMVGHLGNLYLSATAIAISYCAVTGFSLLFGMAGALETIAGRAYGAKQYRKIGIQTNTAILTLMLTCLPLSLLWIFMEEILVSMGQDPLISKQAGRFASFLVPALFAYAVLQPLVRYFQTQSLIVPLVSASIASLSCHVGLCWALVFRSGLGHIGAALSIGVSYWLNVVLLLLYMGYSPSCDPTRAPLSSEVFSGFREFFLFAVPSAAMACLEWWSFELLTLLSGFLPNPELEASVLSLCLSTISALYTIPEGLGAAGSTRVANELGAGNPRGARVAAGSVMLLAVSEALIVSSALFASRNHFGRVFSNDIEVVKYMTAMAPLICLGVIFDSLHGTLSGIARGCGWQDLGAFVNLGAYYFVGIPVAIALSFWWDLRGMGLWVGIVVGSFLQATLLSLITYFTSWEKKAKNARERILQRGSSNDVNEVTEHRFLLS